MCASGHLPVSSACYSVINQKFENAARIKEELSTRWMHRPNTRAGGNSGTFIIVSIKYFPQELAMTKNRGKIGAASDGTIAFSFKRVSLKKNRLENVCQSFDGAV